MGIDEVVERAAVAKATLYRHFPSKDHLVRAFLAVRGERWTHGFLEAGARHRGDTAEHRLLALFDVLDEWFKREDYESCSFVSVLLEMRAEHPVGQAALAELADVRRTLRTLADEAGLRDPDAFARACQLLITGSIVAAAAGDREAAVPARELAVALIERDRATVYRTQSRGVFCR